MAAVRVALAAVLSMFAVTANAASWFVAPNGNDRNRGTLELPFASVTKASSVAQPGDVVNVRGGVYKGIVRIECAGKEGAPIIFRAYQRETPVIDGTGTPAGSNLIQLLGAAWIELSGFDVKNAKAIGIFGWGARNVTIANNHVYGCGRAGIWIGAEARGVSRNISISNNDVHDNVTENYDHKQSRGWPQAIGIYKSEHVDVSGNDVHGNDGEGIAFIVSDHCEARGNRVWDNFSVEIYLDNARLTTVDGNFIYSTGATHYYRNGAPAFGVGAANERYEEPNALDQLTITNNIILRSRSAIFYGDYERGGGLHNAVIANNTCYASTQALLQIEAGTHSNTVIANNIFLQSRAAPLAQIGGPGLTFRNNAWNRADRGAAASITDIVGDPRLANAGGTKPEDYRITAQSRCVNAGATVEVVRNDYWKRPRKPPIDIGATEL
jgi:hypothetical protein